MACRGGLTYLRSFRGVHALLPTPATAVIQSHLLSTLEHAPRSQHIRNALSAQTSYISVRNKRKQTREKKKLKNHKGAMARFKFLNDGRIQRRQVGYRHKLIKKPHDKKVDARKPRFVGLAAYRKKLKRLVPYFKKAYAKTYKGRSNQAGRAFD